MLLQDCIDNRDNNFNLMRVMAAAAVLVTHSFALATGSSAAEPFRETLGLTMGTIAVDVFFIISGFLVTSSLVKRNSTVEFICGRALRIFPGLWVMLLLLVFVLAPIVSELPAAEYFLAPQTRFYLLKCASLFTGVTDSLPGVFGNNPYKSAVNGSLWTMPHEVRMYALLLVAWALIAASRARPLPLLKRFAVGACALGAMVTVVSCFREVPYATAAKLLYAFFAGSCFYLFKDHIRLSRKVFWIAAGCLVLAASAGKTPFLLVYTIMIPYVVTHLAYARSPTLWAYNRVGDYSYGIYIYAFPIQQTVALLMPGVSVIGIVTIAGAVTLLMAVLSWHVVEQPCLRLKHAVAARISRSVASAA